jgi:hypothetical protein
VRLEGIGMARTLFKDLSYSLSLLIEEIDSGEIGLPDIQRPFVWTPAKVRDLFDSMYRGFPVGYLLFWVSLRDPGSRMIGVDGKQRVPRLLIVDGQQRLTSLYAVLKGKPVIGSDYRSERIRIAFRPADGRFEVANATTEQDPEYLPDVSVLWDGATSPLRVIRQFLDRLENHRGVPSEEADQLAEALDRLKDLQAYSFKVIELSDSTSEADVAEVFVRINSKGVTLNQADFILTLMSVFWDKGRAELEDFSRMARHPSTEPGSPFNHFITPDPDQMLRVAIGYGFRRGRLQHVYSLLRGKNLDTGRFSEEDRVRQFERLQTAQQAVLNPTNWHEFLRCLIRAGFRSKQMISSETALLYSYGFWLLGRNEFGVELDRLRDVIARWFFMSHTTRRYTSSPESTFEIDLSRLRGRSTADEFCELLDGIVADSFTPDYWAITLPNELATSASRSPALSAYHAALIMLDAQVLFSKTKVVDVFDPVLTSHDRPIERHHLFRRRYLQTLGVSETSAVNQIANLTLLEWESGVAAPDIAPAEYWPRYAARFEPGLVEKMRQWHALPLGWESMSFEEFLPARRKLIAQVIRQGFERLLRPASDSQSVPSIAELLAAGESQHVEFKSTARGHASDGKMEQEALQAIAGFANADGGTLLIGIRDNGTPCGLDHDYATLQKSSQDGFQLFLSSLVENRISRFANSLIRIDFDSIGGKDVCRVRVSTSPRPLFVRSNRSGAEEFWVRMNGSTRLIGGDDARTYQQQRWP